MMDQIDAEWIRNKLAGKRGLQRELAAFIGVTPDKISKIVRGIREPQARELPKIIAFFDAAQVDDEPLTDKQRELLELSFQLSESELAFLINAARGQAAARDPSPKQSPLDGE